MLNLLYFLLYYIFTFENIMRFFFMITRIMISYSIIIIFHSIEENKKI